MTKQISRTAAETFIKNQPDSSQFSVFLIAALTQKSLEQVYKSERSQCSEMAESNEAPLIRAPSEQTSLNMSSQRGSNRHALKVAGVTLLAAVLIAGQAFTAYTAYSQKDQLKTLERRTDRLQEISSRAMAMRSPVKMRLPMSSLPLLFNDPKDEKKDSPKPEPSVRTQCQLEADGEVKSLLPSFRPKCNDNGDYLAEQCWDGTEMCWCVDKSGAEIPDSLTKGSANCGGSRSAEPVPVEPLLGSDGQ